ncbi:MAG: N-acetylmuramoyl-L-alanine amidase [Eubacteriales bacterium]
MSETREVQKRIFARYALLVFGILFVVIASIIMAVTQKPKDPGLALASASPTLASTAATATEPRQNGDVEVLPTPEATLIMPEKETEENFGKVTMWEAEEYADMMDAAGPTPTIVNTAPVEQIDKLVVIDPGHGGFDGGAVGSVTGVHEDDLNLAVAMFLKETFETNGYQVLMTRSDENAVASTKLDDMHKRYQMIENSGAEIIISIHMNFYVDPDVMGPQVFCLIGSTRGEILANMVSNEIERRVDPERMRSVMAEDYYILHAGNAPSILVECGFLSNAEEEALLMDEVYQIKLANAIFVAADDYMDTY